jgi:DNA-directed RNA polymerase specialized sigma24 family protein
MGQLNTLTEMREYYLSGNISKQQLEGSIFQYLLKNYEKYHIFRGSRDDWHDLLVDLYPRISRAIDTYREIGSSFDSYINAMIHWAYKEQRNKISSHQITEYTWWQARAEESMASSPEAEYAAENHDEPAVKKTFTHTAARDFSEQLLRMQEVFTARQILILFLKSYYFITEKMAAGVSESVNMKKEKLLEMVDKLHTIRKKREEEIHEIEAGIECQYYRCIVYQKRLMYTVHGSAGQTRLNRLLERARLRFEHMRKRLKGIRFDATNGQIAEILNIPKGTVDSSLYSIRKKSELLGFKWEKPLYSKINQQRS